jgi:hypothetical protein
MLVLSATVTGTTRVRPAMGCLAICALGPCVLAAAVAVAIVFSFAVMLAVTVFFFFAIGPVPRFGAIGSRGLLRGAAFLRERDDGTCRHSAAGKQK